MRYTRRKRTRNRAVTALLLPAIVLMWVVGWAFYWIGHQKEGKPVTQPVARKGNVTLVPGLALEQEEPIKATA